MAELYSLGELRLPEEQEDSRAHLEQARKRLKRRREILINQQRQATQILGAAVDYLRNITYTNGTLVADRNVYDTLRTVHEEYSQNQLSYETEQELYDAEEDRYLKIHTSLAPCTQNPPFRDQNAASANRGSDGKGEKIPADNNLSVEPLVLQQEMENVCSQALGIEDNVSVLEGELEELDRRYERKEIYGLEPPTDNEKAYRDSLDGRIEALLDQLDEKDAQILNLIRNNPNTFPSSVSITRALIRSRLNEPPAPLLNPSKKQGISTSVSTYNNSAQILTGSVGAGLKLNIIEDTSEQLVDIAEYNREVEKYKAMPHEDLDARSLNDRVDAWIFRSLSETALEKMSARRFDESGCGEEKWWELLKRTWALPKEEVGDLDPAGREQLKHARSACSESELFPKAINNDITAQRHAVKRVKTIESSPMDKSQSSNISKPEASSFPPASPQSLTLAHLGELGHLDLSQQRDNSRITAWRYLKWYWSEEPDSQESADLLTTTMKAHRKLSECPATWPPSHGNTSSEKLAREARKNLEELILAPFP